MQPLHKDREMFGIFFTIENLPLNYIQVTYPHNSIQPRVDAMPHPFSCFYRLSRCRAKEICETFRCFTKSKQIISRKQ